MAKSNKLTPKQERFVDAYIETGNACEAARKSGYGKGSITDAPNWLNPKKPQFKLYLNDAIKARLDEIKSARTATMTEVMEYLTSVMRGELVEEVVVVEGIGEGCSEARLIEKNPSIQDRTKAAEQLLKRFGKFPKLEKKEQKLKVKKLKAEIKELHHKATRPDNDVDGVQITICSKTKEGCPDEA